MIPSSPSSLPKQGSLRHKTFVLTGTLATLTRTQATELIQKQGGRVTSQISQKTSYLIVGENPGKKLEKGKKLGICILNEQDFMNLVG